ncbi:hypothetical protein TNCV_2234521 [Trichonephila clavipes]|nr:hypothetical protein TNCV_2234521 [Trichonephila clavipes]
MDALDQGGYCRCISELRNLNVYGLALWMLISSTYIVDAFLEKDTIQSIQWPARLREHNLDERLWDALGGRIADLNPLLKPWLRFQLSGQNNGSNYLQN